MVEIGVGLRSDGSRRKLEDRDLEGRISGRMGISGVADAVGMTHRAIRYYEAKGLVSYGRDRENRRVFDAAARERLRRIGLLRSVGLSVPEIAEVIDAEPCGERVLSKLRQRRQALERMLEHVDAVIATADGRHPGARRA